MSLSDASEMLRRFEFRTRNTRESENQAHSRGVARARGFGGSIVGGATVYGQMIQPLVRELGEEWLGGSRLAIRFKSPAYDDDLLEARIENEEVGELAKGEISRGPSYSVRTYNQDNVELLVQ